MEVFIAWLVDTIGRLGYPGIVFLMALESSFFPVPSELVIPPAGYLIFQGEMNTWLVLLAGTIGSLLGAVFNYALAYYLGRPLLMRYGRYFFLTHDKFFKVDKFFSSHGEISTFTGRFIPVVRHFISFPAGLARMNLARFCIYTSLGAGIWVATLAYIGYLVGNNMDLVKHYSRQVTVAVVFCLVIIIAFYIKQQRKA